MSDYLLLLNQNECPVCRRPHLVPVLYGQCRHCGLLLFDVSNNFQKYEDDTGWREYWVFTGKIEGWKHRSQVFEKQALSRCYRAPELDSDYGTPEYNRRQLEKAPERLELKREYNRLRKKPVTVRKTV